MRVDCQIEKHDDRYVIGLDFGTESCRALLVDMDTGDEVAQAVAQYDHGVIDETLPGLDVRLERDWSLQDPGDYLNALKRVISAVLREGRVEGRLVAGIGVDFTSCTLIPTKRDGTPLCFMEEFRGNPHAWVKLWKHHAAQPQADLINQVASERDENFLKYYGGKVSSEWALPKMLQVLREAPEVYRASDRFIEAGDWIVWQLTGNEWRNACAAGYKALWNHEDGYPGRNFLKALDPAFEGAVDEKLSGAVIAPGRRAGTLRPEIAKDLGLSEGAAVSAATIDAHAGVPGCGVARPGKMVMIMGTSTCHMVMTEKPRFFKGFAGLVKDGILPGYYGYEYGQSAVGDIFAWFVENCVPHSYFEEAQSRGISLHALLEEKASQLAPGESGLVALDWHNGNRSVLMDANLRGVVAGYSLKTKPEEVYRALIEATAFGTKRIIETHESGAGPVEEIYACGGLTNNSMLMQIYADVLGRPIRVAASSQPVALGAAIFGASAAETAGNGHDNLAETVGRMVRDPRVVYTPDNRNRGGYERLYRVYMKLHDYFGVRDRLTTG